MFWARNVPGVHDAAVAASLHGIRGDYPLVPDVRRPAGRAMNGRVTMQAGDAEWRFAASAASDCVGRTRR
ncbi:hypothetical protein LBMAG42_44330 [Deltaproteobacteria bacterium]|nr:hypothetical protein LBMAG42_44330 [Deltaproteobacteria bacterium]